MASHSYLFIFPWEIEVIQRERGYFIDREWSRPPLRPVHKLPRSLIFDVDIGIVIQAIFNYGGEL